jgi:pimeloyl-ACP methyl ester carboxylesterase
MKAPSEHAAGSVTAARVYYRTVKIDGLDIFYREAGPKDAPGVLLLHGFPTSSHMFRNLIPALADEFHLVAPDYPGFGNRSMPAVEQFEYTFDHLADIIDKFTEKIGHEVHPVYYGLRRAGRIPPGRQAPGAHAGARGAKRQCLRRRIR